jgi:RecB family endonuclease NucS
MIFRIVRGDPSKPLLEGYRSQWEPAELELERYLLSTEEPDHLERDVFRERLLVVSNQVRTREAKRADILALDKYGNSVIVELKRHAGKLGVDTQALQYLADFLEIQGSRLHRPFLSQRP